MSDVHATNSTPPLPNDPAARTPTGEIKDPATTNTPVDSSTTNTTSPAKTEEKPEGTLATQVEGEKKGESAGPPEKYELTAPEGFELDPKAIEKVTPVFKELGLTNDQANKLTAVYADLVSEAQKAPIEYFENMKSDWRKEVISDRDLGNGKDNLSPEASQNINAFFNAIGDQKVIASFKEAMDLTGSGDHPAFLRAANLIGKQFREGKHVTGKAPAPSGQATPNQGPRSPAQSLYPNLPSAS